MLLIDSEEGSKFQAAGAIVEVDTATVPTGQRSSAQILLVDDSSSRVSVVGWLVSHVCSFFSKKGHVCST